MAARKPLKNHAFSEGQKFGPRTVVNLLECQKHPKGLHFMLSKAW